LPADRKDYYSAELKSLAVKLHQGSTSEAAPLTATWELPDTNVYALLFLNCGLLENVTVTGKVVVRNPYGFLPANLYYKMPFATYMAGTYVVLAATWLCNMCRHSKELLHVHYCIAAVLGLGILENVFRWLLFRDVNKTGLVPTPLLGGAIFCAVFKTSSAYLFALLTSMGWGVIKEYVGRGISLRVRISLICYSFFDCARLMQTHQLQTCWSPAMQLPGAIADVVLVIWIFQAAQGLRERLNSRKWTDTAAIIGAFSRVPLAAACLGALPLLGQLALEFQVEVPWGYHWLLPDGGKHMIFVGALALLMYVLAPSETSGLHNHINDTQEFERSAVWRDDDDPDLETHGLFDSHGNDDADGVDDGGDDASVPQTIGFTAAE